MCKLYSFESKNIFIGTYDLILGDGQLADPAYETMN